jgi:hypothetical protein
LTSPFIHEIPEIKKFGVKDPDHEGQSHDGLFENTGDFFQRLDMITRTQAEWQEMDVRGRNGEFSCKAWMRDPMAVLQEILDNRAIEGKVVWAPRRMYDVDGNRVYTDLYNSHWWWETQVSSSYHFVLTEDPYQSKPGEQDDNSHNLNVRQSTPWWFFRNGDRVAFVHDDWKCPRIRTV